MEQMAGIFIVLAMGIGVGLLSMIFEYILASSADSFRDRTEGVGLSTFLFNIGCYQAYQI